MPPDLFPPRCFVGSSFLGHAASLLSCPCPCPCQQSQFRSSVGVLLGMVPLDRIVDAIRVGTFICWWHEYSRFLWGLVACTDWRLVSQQCCIIDCGHVRWESLGLIYVSGSSSFQPYRGPGHQEGTDVVDQQTRDSCC